MIKIRTLADIAQLSETLTLECKLAAGKDGKGKLPADFWPTYSAFANSHGGVILLGVREKQGEFSLQGVSQPERIITDLFNTVNNPQKVSANLLSNQDVTTVEIEGKILVTVSVPAAHRKQKPVYLNNNPFQGTYRRLHDGDRPCNDETVKRMLAEQVEDSRDIRILPGFSLGDLDLDSLHAYRNMFAVHRPDHPWLALADQEFLQALGGYRQDRQSGEKGLTLAGLLMFGQWTAIQEGVPLYFVDYQEQPEDKTSQTRWLDRVVPDGSWSGNLFDFYRKISRKLVADLKVPFALKGNFRQDDTPLHRALREALVNTLVHADYSDRASILVIKDSQGFVFRNPGLMRVPVEQALRGGESDCRNRNLHQMFLMINLGERAGSGLPKIRQGWEPEGGVLRLVDSFEPYDQTRLEMSWGAVPAVKEKMTGKTLGKTLGKTPGKIIALLTEEPFLTIPAMAEQLDRSTSAVERALRKLREAGKIRRIGPSKGGHWEVVDD